jgi:hypothetical protein
LHGRADFLRAIWKWILWKQRVHRLLRRDVLIGDAAERAALKRFEILLTQARLLGQGVF